MDDCKCELVYITMVCTQWFISSRVLGVGVSVGVGVGVGVEDPWCYC